MPTCSLELERGREQQRRRRNGGQAPGQSILIPLVQASAVQLGVYGACGSGIQGGVCGEGGEGFLGNVWGADGSDGSGYSFVFRWCEI